MDKRVLTLFVLSLFFLSACGSNKNLKNEIAEKDENNISVEYSNAKNNEEIKRIAIDTSTDAVEVPEEYNGLFMSKYDVLSVESDEYQALEVALNSINDTIKNKASDSINDFERWLNMKENMPETKDYLYSSEIIAEIERADNNIVSINYLTHIEMYDSHPIYEEYAYNIDVKTGRILGIDDVVSLNDDFYNALIKSINTDYSDVTFYEKVNLEEDIQNYFEDEEAFIQKYYYKKFSFYITDTDMHFTLGGLEISDDYGGDIVATIPINSKEIKKKITI